MPFNGLSPAEAERLALLAEECGETIQAIGKILRHGYDSRHPNGGPDNRFLLTKEIGDIRAAVSLMTEAGDLSEQDIDAYNEEKREAVLDYLHHQEAPDDVSR